MWTAVSPHRQLAHWKRSIREPSDAIATICVMSVARNAPCPCGSGRKHKHCCLARQPRAIDREWEPVETIDVTGTGCKWVRHRLAAGESSEPEMVEHRCDGERFAVSRDAGWQAGGDAVSLFYVLERLPPELSGWAMRQSLAAVSDEQLTPLGVDIARVVLAIGTVVELVGDPREIGHRRRRVRPLSRRAA